MTDSRRVAIFGGSFDPPHIGHFLVGAYLLASAGVEHLLVVPVGSHAFGKKLRPFSERLKLCQLCFEKLSQVTVLPLEGERNGPSRTYDTVLELEVLYPKASFSLVIGSDLVDDVSSWYRSEELLKRVELLVLPRTGFLQGVEAVPILPEVSSSQVRALLLQGNAGAEALRPLLVKRVWEELFSKNSGDGSKWWF
jgi:nicotinate-nucleotide adenylyltransferase